MHRFSFALGVVVLFGLAACETPVTQTETCTDRSGAVYVKPSGGCPKVVATPVKKPAVPAKPKVVVKPAVVKEPGGGDGGDGGSDGGGGWGG